MKTMCSLEFCNSTKIRAKGLCNGHYEQQRMGKVLVPLRCEVEKKRAEKVTYYRRHMQLLADLGKANQYLCLDCDEIAQDWSLNPWAENQILVGNYKGTQSPISMNNADYSPRCHRHNLRLDREAKRLAKNMAEAVR